MSKEDALKWREEETRKQAHSHQDFATKYGLKFGTEAERLLWEYAWREGHSAGYWEVEMHYRDLAEILLTAYREGKN